MATRGFKHTQAIFIGSVMFVILAIGFISILGSTKSSAPATDTRAKAGVTATLKVMATVSEVNFEKNVIIVNNLQFLDAAGSLGTWTVTPPASFSIGSVSMGTKVTMTIDPTTFLANTHTLTATAITVSR